LPDRPTTVIVLVGDGGGDERFLRLFITTINTIKIINNNTDSPIKSILTNNIPPNHADFEIINMLIDDKYILSLIVFFGL
jgi:hypothetical protein